jgi:hypothetical protein
VGEGVRFQQQVGSEQIKRFSGDQYMIGPSGGRLFMLTKDIGEAIETFVQSTILHDVATWEGDYRAANRNANKLDRAFRKIVRSGDEAREALLAYTDHENLAVAVMASAYSLKYNPETALAALRRLSVNPGSMDLGRSTRSCAGRKRLGQRWQLNEDGMSVEWNGYP